MNSKIFVNFLPIDLIEDAIFDTVFLIRDPSANKDVNFPHTVRNAPEIFVARFPIEVKSLFRYVPSA